MDFSFKKYKAVTILSEMLDDRGYDVSFFTDKNQDEIQAILSSEQEHTFKFKKKDSSDKDILHLCFNCVTKVTKKEFQYSKEIQESSDNDSFQFIFLGKPPTSIVKIFLSLQQQFPKKLIQYLSVPELQFNISKHNLVPKHEKVDEDLVQDILDSYYIKSRSQLPHILRDDPMAKYLGLVVGDIVKITRINETSGEYTFYRCCF